MIVPRDIIAVGDVHGDGERLQEVLRRLGLIAADGAWTGGRTNLVILGDILDGLTRIDTWYSSSMGDVETLIFLSTLATEAERAGGAVTRLIGNHELFGIRGVHDYVHPDDILRAGGVDARHRLFMPGGPAFDALQGWKYVHVENSTIFCHAGIHTAHMYKLQTVEDVRNAHLHIPIAEITEHRLYYPDAREPEQHEKVDMLRALLSRTGCASMVIGHNAVKKPVKVWDEMVTLADCGLSRAFSMSKDKYVLCVRPNGRQETVTIKNLRV